MSATDVVRARIDPELKHRAIAAAEAAGMTVSIAIVLLMRRLADDPDFAGTLKVPNAETIAAIESGDYETFDTVEAAMASCREYANA